MIHTIFHLIAILTGSAALISSEVWLHFRHRRPELAQVTARLNTDMEHVRIRNLQEAHRACLTRDDVLFLTGHGWQPETQRHKALAAPQSKRTPPPEPDSDPEPFTGEVISSYAMKSAFHAQSRAWHVDPK